MSGMAAVYRNLRANQALTKTNSNQRQFNNSLESADEAFDTKMNRAQNQMNFLTTVGNSVGNTFTNLGKNQKLAKEEGFKGGGILKFLNPFNKNDWTRTGDDGKVEGYSNKDFSKTRDLRNMLNLTGNGDKIDFAETNKFANSASPAASLLGYLKDYKAGPTSPINNVEAGSWQDNLDTSTLETEEDRKDFLEYMKYNQQYINDGGNGNE
tara:strand:+ start:1013 stop:1642 length:630 start_codon:yes stop_codon:yes gene_type:complete